MNRLKALIFDNFIIKVFSLIFAVALWYHVVAKGKSEVNFVVPLMLKDLPQDMAVVGDLPGYVDVRVLGQEGILKGLSPRDISASLNLADAKEGGATYYLAPSNIAVPSNITVTSVKPSEIDVKIETVTSKTVPVTPVISGKPDKGYRLEKVDVTPDHVQVRGPKSLLSRIDNVQTRPVDITGTTGDTEKDVQLDIPALKGVVFEQDSATVDVSLTKRPGGR